MGPRHGVVVAGLLFGLLGAHADALAITGSPGGAAAPVSEASGGSEYGVAVAQASRPVLTRLTVPRTVVTGRPPRVTLRIDEKGVGTVWVQVRIIDLSTHKLAAAATLSWSHTGRTLTVPWSSHTRLLAGSYEVAVAAHDHRHVQLVHGAHVSTEATMTVAPPVPAPVTAQPALPSTPAPVIPEAGVPTPAQTVADGAVFPVGGAHNFGGPENRYGAPRSGHIHQGQDILTTEGTPDLAPLSGAISYTSYQAGGAGYYVVEHTSVGFDFMFAHCQADSIAVTAGQGVSAGQQLCKAGQTGDATTPHLHFEIWVGGWQSSSGHPIDPLPYLEAWEH
jgi:hypothetical protein